jgi:hypothetical protein
MSSQFKKFHENVREIEENPRRLVELCDQTCENWSQIEPDVTEIEDWATVPRNIANLINIGATVHFLRSLAGDLRETNAFVWILQFKFRDWDIRTEYAGHKNQDQRVGKTLLSKLYALC